MTQAPLPDPRHVLLAQAGGYRVDEDPDQPGLWLWAQEPDGERCECSLGSEAAAFSQAADRVVLDTVEALELTLSQWEAMDEEEQLECVREAMA